MNSQTSSTQTNAQSNKTTPESVENTMKRLLKIKTYQIIFSQISRYFVSGNFEKAAWAVHASRE